MVLYLTQVGLEGGGVPDRYPPSRYRTGDGYRTIPRYRTGTTGTVPRYGTVSISVQIKRTGTGRMLPIGYRHTMSY
jgi:hypothetical protein